jgi:hypothetical protein
MTRIQLDNASSINHKKRNVNLRQKWRSLDLSEIIKKMKKISISIKKMKESERN